MAGFPSTAYPESTRQLLPVRSQPSIRLDRAQRSSVTAAAVAAQNSQVCLFNNTQQVHILVVRAYSAGPALALPINIGYTKGHFGTSQSLQVQTVLPDRGQLEGLLFQNQGSLFTPDYVDFQGYGGAAFSTGYPFGVIAPGQSMFWITQTVNQVLTVSVLWEVLTPDEFVEQYGSFA